MDSALTGEMNEGEHLRAEPATLAHRDDDLSEFAMSLAHEVRSSLMTMMAATQGLVRVAGADLSEEAQSLVGQILQGIHEASGTIDASLRCSRAGAGLRLGAVDCRDLVASVLEDLQPAAEKAGATVETDLLGMGTVIADREQLALVFSNVLENALAHRVDGRPLRVSITSDDGPVMRTVAVADNGRGIAAGDRERVFRMFERLDRSRPGAGIGLTVCRRVVAAHGGAIWISGNDSGGATIRFTIPRQALTT